jgi:nicotinate-nucleotide adenylyltransferase
LQNYRPEKKRRIGLMGGTFDPIHYAHLVIAEEVRATLELAEMIFIPAGQPPHKPERVTTPAHHRLAMLELALASNPHFTISLVEMDRPGPSYLVDTLRILRAQLGANQDRRVELFFVIGWDSLEEFHIWHDPMAILAQLDHLVAVARPGYREDINEDTYNKQLEARLPGIMQRLIVVQAPLLNISSTDLRQRVMQGRPITYQTAEAVERYIFEHGLYVSDSK